MWYMAMICYSFGFDLDEILQMNIDKFKARYPEGFDTERELIIERREIFNGRDR